MHRAGNTTGAGNRPRIVAGLVCTLKNLEPLSAEPEHFRHEWHPIQPSVPIERLQDVLLAADLDPIADFELPFSHFFADKSDYHRTRTCLRRESARSAPRRARFSTLNRAKEWPSECRDPGLLRRETRKSPPRVRLE